MSGIDESLAFVALRIAVLTMSDTRGPPEDSSGNLLVQRLRDAGHILADRALVRDDIAAIRERVSGWIADPGVNAVVSTGGTGLSERDVTPEAVTPLFDKKIDGFSATFHRVSFESVGLSTLQSRVCAGVCGRTLVFCLPGSNGAVRDGWDRIVAPLLDSRHRPCNLSDLIARAPELSP